MGIFKGKKKMVAVANNIIFSFAWRTNNSHARFGFSAIHLCDILIRVQLVKFVAES